MTQKQVENNLLRKAMQGNTSAFGEIIQKYQSLVFSVAMQILRDPTAAKDVTQDTFVAAFEALKDLRSEDSFPSWLHSIARNRALAWRKERRRVAPLEEAGVLQSSPNLAECETEADRKESHAFEAGIRDIFVSLSDALRFPILLCYQTDMPTSEAARFLGIKEGTLRKRLHDAKKKLQGKIVNMAEQTLQEYRLPPGFARRCICGCRRSRSGFLNQKGKEVIRMAEKKSSCGCGCTSQKPKKEKLSKNPKKAAQKTK